MVANKKKTQTNKQTV